VSRRNLILAAMWSSALVAVVFVFLSRAGETAEDPALAAPGAPVRGPDQAKAPAQRRADLPVQAPPEGPPRMFRGDRRHTGRSAYEGPASAEVVWTHEASAPFRAQVAIGADGGVYAPSLDGHIYCFNALGQLRWERDLGGPNYGSPLVDEDGNVYVGSDSHSFWALASDGATRWRLDTEAAADTGAVLGPEGRIFFGAGHDLWAVTTEGEVVWRFRTLGKVYSTPAVDDDGTIYVGSQDDHLYAVAPDGRVRWSYRTRGDNDSSPVIGDDGTVYFGSDDRRVYALSRDGELRWSQDLEGYIRGPVGLTRDGAVLVPVYGPRPRLVSLDAATGELRWFFPVTVADSAETGVASGPLVDSVGRIYFGANDDYLYALAPTGELAWVFQTAGDVLR
jgi:outer membrane protein assembly factor BamB